MSDWINKIKSEDEQKAQMEQDRRTIASQREAIINYLLELVRTDAEKVNSQLFGDSDGHRKTVEVEENRASHGDKYWNDFCVLTIVFPAAYHYVRLDASKPCLTRFLVTVADMNSSGGRETTLPPIDIKLNGDGRPTFHLDGNELNDEEITEALLAPVVMYHRDGK